MSKTHEIKNKYKFNPYFTFEMINIHNRSSRKLFFFLSFTQFFISKRTKGFQLALCKTENSLLMPKLVFPSKQKIEQSKSAGILKNNLQLSKLESKTLLVYHKAVTSTK